jgi:deazaflavin-dependent oxidoreductase (nitroreductase family)
MGHLHILRGGHYLATHLLLKCVGRKSGKTYITPLTYFVVGGEAVLCASKGGAESHPAWYLNLTASEDVYFQIATQAFRGTWREPEGEERAKVWEFAQAVMPDYTAYQASTARQIPLVMLRAVEEIDIFRQ